MRLPILAGCILMALAAPVPALANPEDEAVLAAFSRPLAVAGGPVWLTVLTNRSMEALWRDDPARATLQIDVANAGTAFYAMGVATRALTLTPEVEAEQGGKRFKGKVVNMANFNGQAVPEGAVVLGLVEFPDRLDLAKPFTLTLSHVTVTFDLPAEAVRRWGEVTMPSGQGF